MLPMSRNINSVGVWQSNNGYYGYSYGGGYVEKRQLFLKSYQFSRKQSLTERIKRSVGRVVKKVVWMKLKSAKRLKRVVWSRLKTAFFYRRRRFSRLLHPNKSSSHCFY
ncbi:uncharacterized protein LOC103859127 [Brassica rapa]|uniref:(rape) hypothetical protein n=1 Tax=Brassica napus TaxID=3708 RepID=A0A816VSQ4_BRANA|nr:uncharacterized protein LOC103859127 [Brassica rapa]XP_013740931.2 uncharacterized protein LOC106443933 [Brassica napus]CAF2126422.1 unnamed protein product [Brassica napus]